MLYLSFVEFISGIIRSEIFHISQCGDISRNISCMQEHRTKLQYKDG